MFTFIYAKKSVFDRVKLVMITILNNVESVALTNNPTSCVLVVLGRLTLQRVDELYPRLGCLFVSVFFYLFVANKDNRSMRSQPKIKSFLN